jgi:hypothetical protein
MSTNPRGKHIHRSKNKLSNPNISKPVILQASKLWEILKGHDLYIISPETLMKEIRRRNEVTTLRNSTWVRPDASWHDAEGSKESKRIVDRRDICVLRGLEKS